MKISRFMATSGLCVVVTWSGVMTAAWGECHLEQDATDDSPVMVRRLVGSCSPDERRSLAVKGEVVLQALKDGRGIELEGVVLSGDVMLDQLPVEPVTETDRAIPLVGERLSSSHIEEVRRIRGLFRLRHVEVQGVIATNLVAQGYLIVEGPASIQDTTLQRSIDFSRTAFLEQVDFSGSNILHEAFFIQTLFTKGANFNMVNFGTHSRFHKVVFGGKASFADSTFYGLAEFLEGTYQEEAEFSNAHFTMGTGFSGSRFQQPATFTRAVFDREAYFRFVEFDGDARFQSATFGAAADFTEGQFHAGWDFADASFAVVPQLPKAQAEALTESGNLWNKRTVQASILAFLVGLLLVFIFRTRWSPRGKLKNSS